jgi:hypothetical protein
MTNKVYLLVFLAFVGCSHDKKTEDKPQGETPADDSPVVVPVPAPPSNVPSGDIVVRQQFMIFHNLKRCWHDAPRLTWDDGLAQAAARDAATCSLTTTSPGDSIAHGQSLGQIKAQDNWYMEFLSYPYGKDTYPDSVGNFARIVWQDSRTFGCAVAKCGGEDVYYCKYSPQADPDHAQGKVKFLKPDFMKCTGTN